METEMIETSAPEKPSASALLKRGGLLSTADVDTLASYITPEYPPRVQRRAAHNMRNRMLNGFALGATWLSGGVPECMIAGLAARPKWDAEDRQRVAFLAARDGIDATAVKLGVSPARVRKAVKG